MSALALLRLLMEQQQAPVLKAACLDADLHAAPVRVLLALAHAQLGEAPEARSLLDALHPDELDLDGQVDLAAVQIALGQFDAAVALLEALHEQATTHSLLLARLAWCRQAQDRLAEARALYARSVALQPRLLTGLNLARLDLRLASSAADWASIQVSVDAGLALIEALRPSWPASILNHYRRQWLGLALEIWLAAAQQAQAEQRLSELRHELEEADWVVLVVGFSHLLAGRDQHAAADDLLRQAIQHYPENDELLSQRAELAQRMGRFGEAAAVLRRMLQLARRDARPCAPLLARLSGVSLQLDQAAAVQLAEQACQSLDSLPADDRYPEALRIQWRAEAQLALAQALSHAQRYDEAEGLFRAVLATYPQQVSALMGLAQQQMQRGQIEDAIALFEQVARLDPARGFSGLANARRFPDDEASLAAIEALARRPSLEGSVHASLLLQLATAWEKRHDYARAFALATESNAASRRLLGYDPKAHRQRCARIRYAFSAALFQHRPHTGLPTRLPVFVLGMPRSGTTLIEQMLAGHSQIHGAGELGLIPQVIAGLERWERHTGSGRHYPDCVDDLSPTVAQGIARKLLEELQAYAPEARHVVDKLPHNFENIGLIKLLFPEARIISVRRDPRDIALSNFFTDYAAKHSGMGFAYDLGWVGEQLADHNLLMHHWNQVFPGELLEVRYEDVLADPQGQARRMLDYIGVAWEPQVLNFSELDRPVKTASVWQVRQPIYQTSKEKWRRYEPWLAPLIAGTNAPIRWDPIEMVTLPEPGLLDAAVSCYRARDLDGAEYRLKQLLHHLPEHAAAHFLLGDVFLHKGYIEDGMAEMALAVARAPFRRDWQETLLQACEHFGRIEFAEALRAKLNRGQARHDHADHLSL